MVGWLGAARRPCLLEGCSTSFSRSMLPSDGACSLGEEEYQRKGKKDQKKKLLVYVCIYYIDIMRNRRRFCRPPPNPFLNLIPTKLEPIIVIILPL